MGFLKYEILEEVNSKSMEIFNGNLVDNLFRVENPSLDELEITIKYKDFIYSENKNKELLKAAVKTKLPIYIGTITWF